MKKRGYLLLSLLLAASLILGACSSQQATETEEGPVVLHWNWGTEPPTADPALATDTVSVDLDMNLFVGLTRFDPASREILPWLAESWGISEDGLVYTFRLRGDVPWVKYNTANAEIELIYDDQGKQRMVNAYDVEYGVKRTLLPDTGSNYAYVLYIIKNAEAVNNAEPGLTLDDVGVKALDARTVEFTLEHPAGYFPAIAGMWVARPVPAWVIVSAGEKWTEPGTIVSNGPYVMTEWIHGSALDLKKNPFYPQADSVQIEEVHGVMIVEESTAFAMYENGELDTTAVPLSEIERVKADPVLSEEYVNAPSICTYYYGFTNNKAPFDDVRVRKAFSMSVDKLELIENVTKGGQIPAGHFAVPEIIFGAPEAGEVGLPFDPQVAKASLQEYLDEKGLRAQDLKLTLLYNTSEAHAHIAEAIQQMWLEHLGVQVTLENMEFKVMLNTLQNTTPLEDMPHIWRMGWCADYPDENNWVYEVFHATAGANELRRGCLDPNCSEIELQEFDQLVEQAQRESDPDVRKELYFQAEKLLSEVEVAYLPIYFYTVVAVDKPYLDRYHDRLSGNAFWLWSIDWEAKVSARGG
jgi:oligopeptide transport system substrate-binding protein